MIVLVSAILSILLHWLVGWEATVLAGLFAGFLSPHGHWFAGACAVALGSAVSVVYSAAIAPASFRVLLDTLGGLAGNIPGEAIVGLTVLLGGVLGALGGTVGHRLRLLTDAART